jgi:hypothetical protein
VGDAVGGLPVLLEGVDADLAARADVGVEDLGGEPACVVLVSLTCLLNHGWNKRDEHFGGAAGNSSPNLNFTLK